MLGACGGGSDTAEQPEPVPEAGAEEGGEEKETMDVAGMDELEVEVTFPESGTLEFQCKFHAGQGMTGSLEVG